MTIHPVASMFETTTVEIDPWAPNAIADDYRAARPTGYHWALTADGPPPKMFSDGTADLPPFTASGIDPELLLKMPARTRHWLAEQPDRAYVLRMFELDSANAEAAYDSVGLSDAVERVRQWARGTFNRKTSYDEAYEYNRTTVTPDMNPGQKDKALQADAARRAAIDANSDVLLRGLGYK